MKQCIVFAATIILIAFCYTGWSATVEKTFQEGVDNYTGCMDTHIDSNYQDPGGTNHGAKQILEVRDEAITTEIT